MRLHTAIFAVAVIAAGTPAVAACPPDGSTSHGVQVESGYNKDSVTQSRGSWSESYLQALSRNGNNSSFYARFASDTRFNTTDQSEEAGVYAALAPNAIANIGAQTSPSHQFLPSFGDEAGLDIRARGGYGAQVQYAQRDYSDEIVDVATLGADRYSGVDRVAVSLSFARLNSMPGTALSERVSYARSFACDVETVSVSNGRDVELTGVGSTLAIYHALSYDVNDVHWVGKNLALDAGAGWYVLIGAYNRFEVRLAIRQRL